MSESGYTPINLTLINKELETTTEFEGKLLGQAVQVYDDNEHLPQELIRIYQRTDGKFVSYMEYSDRKDGVWSSKMCVTEELHLAEIKRGLTRNHFTVENLDIETVPSKILGIAVYHAVESLEQNEE